MPESYVNVNGLKICYEINGNGYPVLLVHALGNKKERWIAQVPVLSKKYKVISFDNRGAGKSERPDLPYTMDMYADDIKGLLDSLKIEKAHIIGSALGGMIAISFTLKYSSMVNKLILINTPTDIPDENGVEMLKKSALEELERLKIDPKDAFWQKVRINYHRDFRKQLQQYPDKKFYGLWSVQDIIREKVTNPPRPQDIQNQIHAIKNFKSLERLKEIKNNTLLIASSHSRLHPKSVMLEMRKRIPNSVVKVIEKAGDNVELSRAPEINQLIIEFLS